MQQVYKFSILIKTHGILMIERIPRQVSLSNREKKFNRNYDNRESVRFKFS